MCVCVCVCVYLIPPPQVGCKTISISKWFEFKVFLLLDWLPYQG